MSCFTSGTMIATPKGERRAEDLKAGDKVVTRDHGIQVIRWQSSEVISRRRLLANSHLQPVLLPKGSLGSGLPDRDIMVSPNLRMLTSNDRTAIWFKQKQTMAAAKHLVTGHSVNNLETIGVKYTGILFDRHEEVLANGAWCECFQPADYSLNGFGNSQRNEIFEIFPELRKTPDDEREDAGKVLKVQGAGASRV